MNRTRALLDSLMGPSRDASPKDRTGEEFKEHGVCKHYLLGCCPDALLGKKLEALRTEFDRESIVSPHGCAKLHSVALRKEFQQHAEHERYRREYEDELLRYLESVIREADSKAAYEKRKIQHLSITPAFHERLCEVCGMKYKLEKKDGLLGSPLGPDCYKDDTHAETDVHQIYVRLRAKLDELRAKAQERKQQRDEAEANNSNGGRSRDRAEQRSRSRSRSRSRRRRSDGRRRSRSAARDRNREQRRGAAASRSRDRERNRRGSSRSSRSRSGARR